MKFARTAVHPLDVLRALPALALLLAAAPAAAQKIAPGLWEHTVTMKTASGEMEGVMAAVREQMAKMTPEQRRQVEQMMARQGAGGHAGAMGMGIASGQPTTVKVCITPEQAAREELPQHDSRCQQTSKERSGNTLRFKFACSGEPPASGEAEITLVSDKMNKGRVTVDARLRGQPERIELEQSGRWLAAECGDVKPRR